MAVDPVIIGSVAALAVLVLFSAMFSATETAFTSLNRIKLRKLAEDGNRRAAKANRLLDNYEKLLTTILVGNNLVNITASSLSTVLFTRLVGAEVGAVYATVIMLIVILACGEITPKCMAKARPEGFALWITPVISAISTVLTPLTWIFEKISQTVTDRVIRKNGESPTLTEDELVLMVDEIKEEGTLEEEESQLIKSAIRFDDKTVDSILTPRVDVTAIEKGSTMEETRNVFLQSGFSRLPVYDGTIDKIIGVVYSKDFFARYFLVGRDESIRPIVRRVRFIPESTTLAKALDEIQRSTVQMLVVVDDYGGTVGIVALEDILEELVGEIWDESDEIQHDIVSDADGGFTVIGDADISDLMEEIGLRIPLGDYDGTTVGGYIQYRLQKPPIAGDTVREGRLELTVTSVRNRRVRLVKATVDPEEAQGDSS